MHILYSLYRHTAMLAAEVWYYAIASSIT